MWSSVNVDSVTRAVANAADPTRISACKYEWRHYKWVKIDFRISENAQRDTTVTLVPVSNNVQMGTMEIITVSDIDLNFLNFQNVRVSIKLLANKCLRCADDCETCNGPTKNQCLTCRKQDNAHLENGACVTGKNIVSL